MTKVHLSRYKDLAWLLIKYGRSDLFKRSAVEEAQHDFDPGIAENLAQDLERLGPTFIKIGQLLSTRAELFPPESLDALARLQDKIEPFSFEQVETIVIGELGLRMSKAFQEFSATPIAAASLGQVHYAILRDGRNVAVKVQRPGIKKQILEDLEALRGLSAFIDNHSKIGARFNFQEMLEEFKRTILRELDYLQEARNLKILGENLKSFQRIVVPAPVNDYTT